MHVCMRACSYVHTFVHACVYVCVHTCRNQDNIPKKCIITSVDHKGVTCYGLRGRGVESRSLMTSVETRDLSGKVDRSRVNDNTKRVGKSRHVDGWMLTTVVILNEKGFDP